MPDERFNLFSSKIFIPVLVLLAVLLAALVIYEGVNINNKIKEGRYIGQDREYKNTISVSGEGKTSAKPDIGQVELSVVTESSSAATAQKDNVAKMNNIIKGMKDFGIKDEDLKTSNYSINPKYNYRDGKSYIIGYEVTQSLEVKIRDLDKTSTILQKASELGSNQVGSLVFTFDDPEKVRAEARTKAIDNAKQKAQELANSLGVSLGKITSFSEGSSGYPSPVYYAENKSAYGMGGGGAAPDIQTGENEITSTVTISYEIY